jgi:hypothetical protein
MAPTGADEFAAEMQARADISALPAPGSDEPVAYAPDRCVYLGGLILHRIKSAFI